MGFDSVLKFFLPKDRVFYSLFEEVATTLVQMGNVFKKAFQEPDLSQRDAMLKSLEDLEHKNEVISGN